MAWSFSSDKPVYLQVAERIRRSVITGEYAAGEQIPSVRALALSAAVNPNTVQHAFTELEDEGIIESRGTLGRFVTEDIAKLELARGRLAKDIVRDFVYRTSDLDISRDTLIEMIDVELELLVKGESDERT